MESEYEPQIASKSRSHGKFYQEIQMCMCNLIRFHLYHRQTYIERTMVNYW